MVHGQSVRILTWNVWWRFGPWQSRQPAIERTLVEVDADVVLMQEVWAEKDGKNQAAELATKLGFHHEYAAATEIDGVELGNAILSRYPLLDAGSIRLPTSDDVPEGRCAVHAIVDAPVGAVPVATTHLTWQRNNSRGRQEQVRAIFELINTMPRTDWPPILGGDFNSDPDSDEIRMITGKSVDSHKQLVFQDAWIQGGDGTAGYTWTPECQHYETTRDMKLTAMPWLKRRLDYLFVGLPDGRLHRTLPIQVENAWLAGRGDTAEEEGSDHYAVVADLRPHFQG